MNGRAKKVTIYWKSEDKVASEYTSFNITFEYTNFNTLNMIINGDLHVFERSNIAEVIFEGFTRP